MSAAEMVDHALVRTGLTVAGAADKANVARSTIYRLRSGDRLNRDVIHKVATALEIDPVDLWVAMNATATDQKGAA